MRLSVIAERQTWRQRNASSLSPAGTNSVPSATVVEAVSKSLLMKSATPVVHSLLRRCVCTIERVDQRLIREGLSSARLRVGKLDHQPMRFVHRHGCLTIFVWARCEQWLTWRRVRMTTHRWGSAFRSR